MARQEPAWSYPTQTRNVQISIDYKFLEAHRSVKVDKLSSVKYLVSLYLGEASYSLEGDAFMPFTVDVETEPETAFFRIKGGIFVKGPRQTVEQWTSSGDNAPPKLWFQVYREALKMLSSLAYHIQVPPPNKLLEEMGLSISMKQKG